METAPWTETEENRVFRVWAQYRKRLHQGQPDPPPVNAEVEILRIPEHILRATERAGQRLPLGAVILDDDGRRYRVELT
jgi:hypothetical protein